MSMAAIIARFRAVEQASLAASVGVLTGWAKDAEQIMQRIAPLDANDSPDDWHVSGVQATATGASVNLIYSDPAGVLSAGDLHVSGEDLQTITSTVATLGPDLTTRLKQQVWR